MFKPVLERCLKEIFGLQIVRYGAIELASEKGVVYVELTTVKATPRDGSFYFRVKGRAGILEEKANYKYGYLKDRLRLASIESTSRFTVSAIDDVSNTFSTMDDVFIRPTFDFTFRANIPYNPPAGKIERVDFVERDGSK